MTLFRRTALILAIQAIAAAEKSYVSAELILAPAGNGTVLAGVLFSMTPGAHIYWQNPGSTGLPTEIKWRLPEGYTAGHLDWPVPARFEDPQLGDVSYGYEKSVFITAALRTDKENQAASIACTASWLVCLEDGACIPESTDLSAPVPTAASTSNHSRDRFDALRARFTYVERDGAPAASLTAGELRIEFPRGTGEPTANSAPRFFPFDGPPWNYVASAPGGIHFISPDPAQVSGTVEGILVFISQDGGADRAFQVTAHRR